MEIATFLNKYFQIGIITQTLAFYILILIMMRMAMSQQILHRDNHFLTFCSLQSIIPVS